MVWDLYGCLLSHCCWSIAVLSLHGTGQGLHSPYKPLLCRLSLAPADTLHPRPEVGNLSRARAQRAASPAQPFPNHTPRALAAPLTLLLSLPTPGHPRIPLQCLAAMSRSCMSSTDPAEVPQPAGVCREAAPLLVWGLGHVRGARERWLGGHWLLMWRLDKALGTSRLLMGGDGCSLGARARYWVHTWCSRRKRKVFCARGWVCPPSPLAHGDTGDQGTQASMWPLFNPTHRHCLPPGTQASVPVVPHPHPTHRQGTQSTAHTYFIYCPQLWQRGCAQHVPRHEGTSPRWGMTWCVTGAAGTTRSVSTHWGYHWFGGKMWGLTRAGGGRHGVTLCGGIGCSYVLPCGGGHMQRPHVRVGSHRVQVSPQIYNRT